MRSSVKIALLVAAAGVLATAKLLWDAQSALKRRLTTNPNGQGRPATREE